MTLEEEDKEGGSGILRSKLCGVSKVSSLESTNLSSGITESYDNDEDEKE